MAQAGPATAWAVLSSSLTFGYDSKPMAVNKLATSAKGLSVRCRFYIFYDLLAKAANKLIQFTSTVHNDDPIKFSREKSKSVEPN